MRSCTCHPSDKPPVPCTKKYAYSECVAAAGKQRLALFRKFLEKAIKNANVR